MHRVIYGQLSGNWIYVFHSQDLTQNSRPKKKKKKGVASLNFAIVHSSNKTTRN